LVALPRVAAVRRQRDGEALVRQRAQEGRLAERVAVVPDEAPAAPAEADPAEAPRVAEDVLVRQLGLLLGHRCGTRLAEDARAVGREPGVQIHAGPGEDVAGAAADQASGAGRAREPPGGGRAFRFASLFGDVPDGCPVEKR